MGKKSYWPVLMLLGFIGYLVGDEPEKTVYQPVQPLNTTQEVTSQKLVAPTKRPLVVALPSAPANQKPVTPIAELKPAQVSATTMYVDASRLNVRSLPSKNGKQVWTLKRDEEVRVTHKNGDWLFVQGTRYSGWVFGTYLTAKPSGQVLEPQPFVAARVMSVSEVKQTLIKRSHAYYSGNCPCPYNLTRSGRRCGGRSAYSRPGGAAPLCYESDVSDAMVSEYRARQ